MSVMKERESSMRGSLRERGFISLTFLIVLTLVMSIVTAKIDYLNKANEVYLNLREFESVFEKEAQVISEAKCILAKEQELYDFQAGRIDVRVYRNSRGYELYFDEYVLTLTVHENEIVDFEMKRYGSF